MSAMYGSNSIYESAMSPCSDTKQPPNRTLARQSSNKGISDVGSGGSLLERATISGVMIGDIVWLRDDGSGELSSIVFGEEEALQELMAAPFIVVNITGGKGSQSSFSKTKSISPYRVTCQRLSHHKYFRALLLKLQRSAEGVDNSSSDQKGDKKDGVNPVEANTECLEVGINSIVCENLSLLSFYSFLRRNYFPGGEYRPKYLKLLEPSVGGGGNVDRIVSMRLVSLVICVMFFSCNHFSFLFLILFFGFCFFFRFFFKFQVEEMCLEKEWDMTKWCSS